MRIIPMNIYVPEPRSTLQNALSGAQKSQSRFAQAAQDLTSGFAAAANAVSTATARPAAPAADAGGGALSAQTALTTNNINVAPERAMADIITSQRAFEANLKVIATDAEMQDEMIDVIA